MRFFVAAVGLGVAAGVTVSGTCAMTKDGSVDWQFTDSVDGWNTGWDITKGSLKYNGITGSLAIELECTANGQWGPCGDADGDGDPDSATSDDFLDQMHMDESKLGGSEAITCALYFDSADRPSVAIGDNDGQDGFALANFDNTGVDNHKNIFQWSSFGDPITATTATIQYPSTVAAGTRTNLMFTIADARLLPGWSGVPGLRLKCFAGSSQDGVGEDFIGTHVVPIDLPDDCGSTCGTCAASVPVPDTQLNLAVGECTLVKSVDKSVDGCCTEAGAYECCNRDGTVKCSCGDYKPLAVQTKTGPS